ncbi:MAG: GNAT family N-acetyltransferase [Deltaproteobacteria bacterium]|nr:GNAT family N-acetyltransferase [Deltaproteobacteria bacterium]MBW2414600.1 GNAT family N-acetyltransferase [Deltaproteobacteria bacterium]
MRAGGETPGPASAAPPRVRAALAEDIEAVVRLWIDLIEYHRSLDPDYPPLPNLRETLRAEARRGVDMEHCEVFVALSSSDGAADGLVGFLFAELEPRPAGVPVPPTGQIHELWVDPERRRAGVGRALVDEADAFFAARGSARVSVRVEEPNEAGREFWRRLGFRDRARIMERIR